MRVSQVLSSVYILSMPRCISNWNPNDHFEWKAPSFGGFFRPKIEDTQVPGIYLQCLPGSSFLCVKCVPKITQTNPTNLGRKFTYLKGHTITLYYIIYNKRPTEICESSILSDKASSSAPLSIQGRWAMHTWTTTAYRSDTDIFHPPPRGGRKKDKRQSTEANGWPVYNKQMGGR